MSTITLIAGPTVRGRRPASPIRAAQVRSARRPSALRLTRRGRCVAVFVITLLALATFSIGRTAVGASPSSAGPALTQVTVQPGDTLWAIAKRVAPGDDPRDTIHRILEINGLHDSAVQAGQRLGVPASG
jgi:nucleoid-associated protein YgaU